MFKIDLKNLNPGTWFTMEGGGKVCLRLCAGDDYLSIRKACVKKKVEFKKGGRWEFDETNDQLMSQMIWDFSIVDWEDFYDAENNPIPCNKDMKVLLMGKSIIFSKFVTDALTELGDLDKKKEEEEAKN